MKSFALAIVGAEYLLRWLEPGTHRWEQFVTPEELALAARQAGLKVMERKGVVYDPLRRTWRLSGDLGVNYQLAAKKPRESLAERARVRQRRRWRAGRVAALADAARRWLTRRSP